MTLLGLTNLRPHPRFNLPRNPCKQHHTCWFGLRKDLIPIHMSLSKPTIWNLVHKRLMGWYIKKNSFLPIVFIQLNQSGRICLDICIIVTRCGYHFSFKRQMYVDEIRVMISYTLYEMDHGHRKWIYIRMAVGQTIVTPAWMHLVNK